MPRGSNGGEPRRLDARPSLEIPTSQVRRICGAVRCTGRRGRAALAARCPFPAPGDTRRASRSVFRVRRCAALSAGPKARQVGNSAPRVAARCPVAVRSAARKMRPHRRFARTAAPRSLVTRHLPLPVQLELYRRLPIFVSRPNGRIPLQRPTASARPSPRCSRTSRARPS